jgi:hypothetical protein
VQVGSWGWGISTDGMPAIRLDGDAERLRSGWLNGIKKLPVSYT